MIEQRSCLPSANAVLFVFQIAVTIGIVLFAPEGSWAPNIYPDSNKAPGSGGIDSSGSLAPVSPTPTAPTLSPAPLDPPAYVLYIWVPIYIFTGFTVITDRFYPIYSFYLTSDDPVFLRQWFQLACLCNISWLLLDKWFGWVHLAFFTLGVLWCSVLPLYLYVVRHPRNSQSWSSYFCSEFSVRLYFGWVSTDFILSLSNVMQYLHGGYFGFRVYGAVLMALLLLAFGTYVHGRDPVVGHVVTWSLIGLIVKHATFPGDTQEVFEKLQAVAIVVAPVFPILVFIDSVRYAYVVYWKGTRMSSGSDEYFKSFVFETTAEYGTFNCREEAQCAVRKYSSSTHIRTCFFAHLLTYFIMEGSWFALGNAALLLVQAVVNIVYAKQFVTVAREYETLITPASYALVMWILVYVLEAVLVTVDVLVPRYSMFADANQPAQLRLCFGLTCILNTIWVFLYVFGHVYASTVVIFALWVAVLVLYIYAVNDRNARDTGPFDWMLYLCNELPISVYFAWVTTVAFTELAMLMQHLKHDFVSLTTYVSYLSVVIVLGLLALRYAQDLIAGIVIVWYLIAVSVKHVSFPESVKCMDVAVRASAGQGAAVLGALLAISLCHSLMEDR
ncbi:hypothetical protein PsorP6_008583 [Peronosclerospora sorghi]|uniref:Uncharacterized protein n=1 Tax=Peronosclerospora sorghi TaxID=230839 RepID=A0ACC0WCY9_9STRA|nr:hypothetical protein PsorP6_008583 [Peronosclerospora sorghi]